jgi:hypothetical protein
VAVVQFDAKHRVWKRLGDFPLNFNDVFLGQISSDTGQPKSCAGAHHSRLVYHLFNKLGKPFGQILSDEHSVFVVGGW